MTRRASGGAGRGLGRALCGALAGACVLLAQRSALAADEPEAFARVVVAETELRSGPGVSHRVIERAERGDTFLLSSREGTGFWLGVLLPDGREAFVLGDTVETVALDEDASDRPSTPGFFAPSALNDANAGFALMAGVFDRNGYAEVRPAWVIAPAIALEPYAGLHLNSEGKGILYGGGGTLTLAPDWAIAPYLHLGGGGYTTIPNEDAFAVEKESVYHARAGGGFLISLRWRILVRLEATNTILFTEDSYRNTQSYVGGFGAYF